MLSLNSGNITKGGPKLPCSIATFSAPIRTIRILILFFTPENQRTALEVPVPMCFDVTVDESEASTLKARGASLTAILAESSTSPVDAVKTFTRIKGLIRHGNSGDAATL